MGVGWACLLIHSVREWVIARSRSGVLLALACFRMGLGYFAGLTSACTYTYKGNTYLMHTTLFLFLL